VRKEEEFYHGGHGVSRRRIKCQIKSMNHANVHIPVIGTGIVRLVRITIARTDHQQIAEKPVMRRKKVNLDNA